MSLWMFDPQEGKPWKTFDTIMVICAVLFVLVLFFGAIFT